VRLLDDVDAAISLSGPADASRPLLKVSSTHTSPSEFAVYEGLLRITHVLALCCYEFFVSVVTVRDTEGQIAVAALPLRLRIVPTCSHPLAAAVARQPRIDVLERMEGVAHTLRSRRRMFNAFGPLYRFVRDWRASASKAQARSAAEISALDVSA